MNVESIIRIIAETKGVSYEEAEKEFAEYESWNSVYEPPTKVSSVGKSDTLRIILKDGSEIEGYYSPICGYSTTSSFYSEHLIDTNDIKLWKYKD